MRKCAQEDELSTDQLESAREPLLAERRRRIMETIQVRGGASVEELAQLLAVSTSTVRRDLLWLASRNLISRTWGGGVSPDSLAARRTTDLDLARREEENPKQKAAIARAAASLVNDGEAVVIDAGSTTELMVPHLLTRRQLTVITTSLRLAWDLRGQPNIELIVAGGHVQQRAGSLVGLLAEQALAQLYVDTAFVGARGLTPQEGLTNPVLDEVPVKRLMLKIAKRSVALVDSAKWGRVFMGLIAPASSFDVIVTDSGVPDAMRREVELMGTEVLVAE